MDSLKNIISDIRIFLYGGIQKLPLTIAGTILILGLFTANYAMLFFLLGFLILAPTVAKGLNIFLELLIPKLGFPNAFRVKTSDVCKVITPFTTLNNPVGSQEENVIFSPWLGMSLFFIGYLFTNGVELYKREPVDNTLNVNTTIKSDIEKGKTTRKSQAMIAIISTILFGMVIIGFRLYSECENKMSILLTTIVFTYLGHLWYLALSSVGEDRLSDLFGIANRLLPPAAIENKPIACIPIPV